MTRCNTWSCSVAVEQHLNTETMWKEPPFGGETESLMFHPKERESSSYKRWLKKRCTKEGLCYLALFKRRYRWSVFLRHGHLPLLSDLQLDTLDGKYLSEAFHELNIAVNYPMGMIHVYRDTNVIYESGYQKMKNNGEILGQGFHHLFRVGSTVTQAQVTFHDTRTEEGRRRGEAVIMTEENFHDAEPDYQPENPTVDPRRSPLDTLADDFREGGEYEVNYQNVSSDEETREVRDPRRIVARQQEGVRDRTHLNRNLPGSSRSTAERKILELELKLEKVEKLLKKQGKKKEEPSGPEGPEGPGGGGGGFPGGNPGDGPGGGLPGPRLGANMFPIGPPQPAKGPKIAAPMQFDGKKKDVHTFLRECKMYMVMRRYEFPDEMAKMGFILSYCKGPNISEWTNMMWEMIEKGDILAPQNARQLCEEIQNQFGDPHEELTARAELDKCHQSGTVDTYIVAFRTLALQTGYGEPELINRYMKGLKPNILDKCFGIYPLPSTLENWFEASAAFQRHWEMARVVQSSKGTNISAHSGSGKQSKGGNAPVVTKTTNSGGGRVYGGSGE